MMCDARDVPLDDFEQDILDELLAAQRQLVTEPGRADTLPAKVTVLRSRRRRGAVWGIAAAAAATIGITSFAVISSESPPAVAAPVQPTPTAFTHGSVGRAIELLNSSADKLAATPIAGGPVDYSEVQSYALQVNVHNRKAATSVETTLRQVWLSPDGSSLVRQGVQYTTPAGDDIGGPQSVSSSGGWVDVNQGFPTTVSAARAALRDPRVTTKDAVITMASDIGSHLDVGSASPAQTAALYRVLAQLPGLFYAGTVTDNTGRTGEAVGIVISDSDSLVTGTEYFIVNPATGQFLEDEQIDTPGPPPGLNLPRKPTIAQYDAVLTTAHVSGQGATPSN